ncbi:MAG: type II secretion system GspH family protein [Zoogloeaceae bacterium]|jgi:prepilin-type N-terminal cleavage/methylation domain-containing protein|nr:type II secretion system GspH family protein [Zoogloeaceae bacterium]
MNNDRIPRRARAGLFSSGFTLAELLVVVAVLSATALAAFGLVSEDRAQARIDDTRNRLTILRRAILGPEAPVYGGEMRLAGYVADNGRLPGNLGELLSGAGHSLLAGLKPRAPGSIDEECLQTGVGDDLDGGSVLKGHRGNYLAGVAHKGAFRDGWGNVNVAVPDPDAPDANFGWLLSSVDVGKGIEIRSLGADNALDDDFPPNSAPEADQITQIDEADWLVPLGGWTVTLKNVGDEAVNALDEYGAGHFGHLGFVLLVFENVGVSGRWREYRSNWNSCGSSSGTEVPDLVPGGTCTFMFVENADKKIACGSAHIDAKVPLGRHVLTLTVDNGLPSGPARHIVTLVDFFPGAHPPNLTLAVRK